MILHLGERVYWGAPEVIYLEGAIISLDEQAQMAIVRIDRATIHSAHLIGTDVPFAADGIKPLVGDSPPPGTTTERSVERVLAPEMNDEEKVRSAAAVAVHQQYGYKLDEATEAPLIDQVFQLINNDPVMRKQIITSMNEILRREF